MDSEKFDFACQKTFSSQQLHYGIGTLGEGTLHAVLKNYFEPDETFQEIKIGRYYADIFNESGIIEIQTRQFNKLCGKLKLFLPQQPVTLVYPVALTKWLIWIDGETRETTKRRLSPKKGSAYEIFYELYRIRDFLRHENLRLCIVLLDIEEYRLLNGWSEDGKRGSWREDRIPRGIQKEIYINSIHDYSLLIPEALPRQFTSRDFSKASGLGLRYAQTALNVLNSVEAVCRIGKDRNLYIYERKF